MKKIRRIISLWMALAIPLTAWSSPVEITNINAHTVQIKFRLDTWRLYTESFSSGQRFQYISMANEDKYGITADEGYPELPQITVFIAAPQSATGCSVSYTMPTKGSRTLSYKIRPFYDYEIGAEAPTVILFNEDYYSGVESPHLDLFELSEIYEVMDQKAVAFTIYPFIYTPATNQLIDIQSVIFTLTFSGSATKAPMASTETREGYLAGYFENYNKAVKGDVKKGNYLIIAPAEYKEAVSIFAAYKNSLGFDSRVATTDVTGNTPAQVKTYVKNLGANGFRPDFILLVGDIEKIKAGGKTDPNDKSNPLTDQGYRKHSDDKFVYGDYFVGRWPVENKQEVVNAINRTIAMEYKYSTILPHALLVQGYGTSKEKEYRNKALETAIKDGLNPRNYTYTKLYEGNVSYNTVKNTLSMNTGSAIVIFSGHGNPTQWGFLSQSGDLESDMISGDAFSPMAWGFSCQTGFYKRIWHGGMKYNFSSIIGVNSSVGLVSYFGSSINVLTTHSKFLVERVLGYGMKQEKLLAPMVHAGMERYRSYCKPRRPKKADMYMKSFNLMGDPAFQREGLNDIPENITMGGDVYCISGIDVIFKAKQEIKINGDFVVKSGAKLTLIAPNVILDEGFTVEEGGELCILNE